MEDRGQQVPYVIIREGEESPNKENFDRYQCYKDKNASERKVHYQHHSIGSHCESKKPKSRYDVQLSRN